MRTKSIDRTLLKQAFIQVYYTQSKKRPQERRARPIPAWKHEYLSEAADCIIYLRMQRGQDIKAHELLIRSGENSSLLNFKSAKKRLLGHFAEKRDWTAAERNLFSSVTSTYIGFDRHGVKKKTVDQLRDLEQYFNMFNFPDEETL